MRREKKPFSSLLQVFGILTQSGGILWKHYCADFAPFEQFSTSNVPLFHIRSAAHYTHQPLASIVYRDRNVPQQIHVQTFNPYTGEIDSTLSTSSLPYRVKRVFLSTQIVDEFCKVLLFVDTNNKVRFVAICNDERFDRLVQIHTYPPVAIGKALSSTVPTYIYLYDKQEDAFIGYYLSVRAEDEQTVSNARLVKTIERELSGGSNLTERKCSMMYQKFDDSESKSLTRKA